MHNVKWSRPRTLKSVDPRTVINSDQARRLLGAVRDQKERGGRMVAFFGCMYYAALRPEEAVDLRPENLVSLPEEGWGEMLLTHAEPRSGTSWTDNGLARQRRELKHRAPGETRPVPIHPELVKLLLHHVEKYPTASGGRIFVGPRGGILTDRAYLAVFHRARGSLHRPRGGVPPRPPSVRSPARRRIHLAQCRSRTATGCRLGRAQRGRPPARLRRVHLGTAGRGQATRPRRYRADSQVVRGP
jgi:integrase